MKQQVKVDQVSNGTCGGLLESFITLAISKCYGKVRVLFFRAVTHFTRQVTQFTRSWSSGKMLAFQPRGFVFEPVRMR